MYTDITYKCNVQFNILFTENASEFILKESKMIRKRIKTILQ